MNKVTIENLYQVIGAQNVEAILMRNRIAELEAQVKALTPEPPTPPAA